MVSFAENLAPAQRMLLTQEHIAELRKISEELGWPAGHILVRPGEPLDTFVFILEGAIEVFDPRTNEAYLPSYLGPGQFKGEIAFLNGSAAALALRTREPSLVLCAGRSAMLRLTAKVPEISDIVVSVFAGRRRRQVESGDGNLTLIGSEGSADVRKIESFLSLNKIPFDSLRRDDPKAIAMCNGKACAGVIFGTEGLIEEPTAAKVTARLEEHCSPG